MSAKAWGEVAATGLVGSAAFAVPAKSTGDEIPAGDPAPADMERFGAALTDSAEGPEPASDGMGVVCAAADCVACLAGEVAAPGLVGSVAFAVPAKSTGDEAPTGGAAPADTDGLGVPLTASVEGPALGVCSAPDFGEEVVVGTEGGVCVERERG